MIALGGNALQPPGERGEIQEQFAHMRESLAPIVALAASGWRIAIVHGNGPQIGDELLRNERAAVDIPPLPLGVLVASTAGWIGFMIQQTLRNALRLAGIDREVVTVVTQAVVRPDEDAHPEKPVGRVMDEATARRLAQRFGWNVAPVDGGWRRRVLSPRPVAIVEAEAVRTLVDAGVIVIAAGGGGTPVREGAHGTLEPEDAVIDKDRAAAVLGRAIGAELLLILTNVDGVYREYGTPNQRLIERLTLAEAEELIGSGELGGGSMQPKVEAAVDFIRSGGRRAHIARLDQGLEAVTRRAGTTIEMAI
ncbi:MAG TPA: carbamate kinase [Longimicrobiales bacterium]|nr:carbamate kinase [Longimicrobiales bacterium]